MTAERNFYSTIFTCNILVYVFSRSFCNVGVEVRYGGRC